MYSICDFVFLPFSTDTGFGTIYVSDDRGTVYSKSLERHLYTTTGGDTDFTNVTSLRGVFITSVLAEGSSTYLDKRIETKACSQIPVETHTHVWLLDFMPEGGC